MIRKDCMDRLKEAGLRATPQRIAILQAISDMSNHPTAEQVLNRVHKKHPEISLATIYNTLEVLVNKGIVKKVKTEKDTMRYDAMGENHHHLYCFQSDRIEDYHCDELDEILSNYFSKHRIDGFEISDIKLQINGKFITNQITKN